MPGAESLGGLVYQQRYTYFCVLSQLALEATGTADATARVVKFSVEGWIGDHGPVWDIVFEYSDGVLELHESKDTAIAKGDRLTFYDRLRRQIAAGTPADKIRPVWVTDPDKQTPNALTYLEGIAASVENLDLSQLPVASPARMNSVADAIQEAVHRLCHYGGEEAEAPKTDKQKEAQAKRMAEWPRPCTFEEAMAVLKNLRVVRQKFTELDQSIQLLTTGVFTSGTPDSLQKFVTGVLTERVVSEGKAEFRVDEFLQAVDTVALEHGLVGMLRDLMAFNSASGLQPHVRRIEWRNLPGTPVTGWTLAERVPAYDTHRSACLLAEMGNGKTVASQLSFEQQAAQGHPNRTLRIEARSLDDAHLDALLRLCCMLCGVGPTWLAIDGLDEASHPMREHWIRVLSTLVSLPNLTILVTIRREVFTVHEWLAEAVTLLPKVDLQPLSTQQVEQAFANVGLPVPNNAQLLAVLRNPFLLSLYADIITPADMPLAQSGEVTAFRVIGEFWSRRVRGASEGQRAIGDIALLQEAKRKAAVYLGEQTLAGALIISRTGLDAEVENGIEMLRREGVLREQGSGAVVWAHDWLREYALVETIRSRIETVTVSSLAATISTVCTTDHVARAAAAAGLKWVSANLAAGSPTEYVSQLARHNLGLAREALIVFLEASPVLGTLAQLPDELLAEAITMAVSLRVPHWSDQAAALDEARFFGPVGERLHLITVEYELGIAPGSGQPSPETVRRLAARDLKRRKAKLPSYPRTAAVLLEKIVATAAYGDPQVDEWLLSVGGVSNARYFGNMRDALAGLIAAGALDLANNLYRATMGFNDAERGAIIADTLVARRFTYEQDFIDILHTPGLLANVNTWGRTAIELLARLVEAKQRRSWPSTRRFIKALGAKVEDDTPFEPNYDEDARVTTLDTYDEDEPFVRMRRAIEQNFAALVALDNAHAFRALADLAIETGYAAVVTIPLLVLYDAAGNPSTRRDWHEAEIVRLLLNTHVLAFDSLHDVRRLLRQQLPPTLSADSKAELTDAIRQSLMEPIFQVRELDDLRDWQVLTAKDLENIDLAEKEEDLRHAVDPRTEPLFHVGRGPIPTQPRRDSDWPYADDDEHIRVLQTRLTFNSTDAAAPDTPVIARQIQAINAILARPEAKTERWIGAVLGWCNNLLSALRRYAASQAEPGQRITLQAWEDLLNSHAPWWRELADLALQTLHSTIPQHHIDKPLERTLSWSSNDPILTATDYLDTVLAIEPVSPFAELQARLTAAVTKRWNSWPLYTKGTVLSSLRTWFIGEFPPLRALLTELVKTEPDQFLVRYAITPLLTIAHSKPVPELTVLLERAKSGGHDDSLAQVAQFLAAAYLQQTIESATAGQETSSLLEKALLWEWPDRNAQMQFLRSVMFGARDAFRHLTAEEREKIYDQWLNLIELVVAMWPFKQENSGDRERFPLDVILQVLENEPSVEIRTRLFLRLAPVFETIVRHGELAAFCQLHFALKRFITGGWSPVHGSEERLQGVIVTEAMEMTLAVLCRASMERVVTWHKQGTKTDDQGWASALRGEDTVELIERCIGVSQNRERLKRDLLPCVELLAAATQPDRAAALRIYLRNA